MRKSLLPCLAALTLALSACAQHTEPAEESPAPESTLSPLPTAAPQAEATEWRDCPYLDTAWLAQTNGQKVTRVGVDPSFDTPACIFWSYPEDPQATIIVEKQDSVEAARALVDATAPVSETELAEFEGWSGGRGIVNEHAVYAVQKDTTAVLVWSNQLQTLKTELIAQEVIRNLGL
ncbi:DUF2020 domain-containing protein [Corynebacterium sp.]|uniref:DUF2020 domain-containing protein n=1 Tax=Corynebacterium sp. TaxID=1720 RepID=UPI0026DBA465|nr:DUF2020 domain-containing protein [Corynebacterium sp.]MDO5032950.1 DUF2020 domain-containing protein [Corynebacterium sp.]